MRSYPGLLLKLLNLLFLLLLKGMLLKSAKVKKELQQFHNKRKTKLAPRIVWFTFLSSLLLLDLCYDHSPLIQMVHLDMARERKKRERTRPSHLIRFTLEKRSLIGLAWEKVSRFLTQDWPHGNQILSLDFMAEKFCKNERKTHYIIILGWIAAFTLISSFGSFIFFFFLFFFKIWLMCWH